MHPHGPWGWFGNHQGVKSNPQMAKGVVDDHLIFSYFLVFFLNNGILGINMYIKGNFGSFVQKNACAVHVSHFLSKKMEITNKLVRLRILKTLLEYIAIFLKLEAKLKKWSNFRG